MATQATEPTGSVSLKEWRSEVFFDAVLASKRLACLTLMSQVNEFKKIVKTLT